MGYIMSWPQTFLLVGSYLILSYLWKITILSCQPSWISYQRTFGYLILLDILSESYQDGPLLYLERAIWYLALYVRHLKSKIQVLSIETMREDNDAALQGMRGGWSQVTWGVWSSWEETCILAVFWIHIYGVTYLEFTKGNVNSKELNKEI